jgi:predicted AAA+ superfamily ATPase
VQVTYASAVDEIDRRELKSLAEAVEVTGRRPLLITWDIEDVLEIRGVRVEAIPLWRWLLSQTPGRAGAQTTV